MIQPDSMTLRRLRLLLLLRLGRSIIIIAILKRRQ
jgi:hypothetical protein